MYINDTERGKMLAYLHTMDCILDILDLPVVDTDKIDRIQKAVTAMGETVDNIEKLNKIKKTFGGE